MRSGHTRGAHKKVSLGGLTPMLYFRHEVSGTAGFNSFRPWIRPVTL